MMFKRLLMFMLSACLKFGKPWLNEIQKAIGTLVAVIFFLVVFFASLFVLTIVFYLAGLLVVGKKRALLSDAFVISLLGTLLSTIFFMFIPYGLLALALSILTWLLLIKRLYETGWLGAIAVGLLAVIIYLALLIIIALIFGVIEAVYRLLTFGFIL